MQTVSAAQARKMLSEKPARSNAVRVPLSGGRVALIDECDAAWALKFSWYGTRSGRKSFRYYAMANQPGGTRRRGLRILMHREIAGAMPGQFVDHINGDSLDNRRCNLRVCSRSQNAANRSHINNPTGFKGVFRERSGWSAKIRFEHKSHYLGCFSTPETAARAYDVAAAEIHGEFARLNFPGELTYAAKGDAQ